MLSQKELTQIRKTFNDTEQRTIFKILSDANRYRMVKILNKYSQLAVSDIAKILNISIPLASQHLKILEQGNVLEKKKQGQKVHILLKKDNVIVKAIIKDIIERLP